MSEVSESKAVTVIEVTGESALVQYEADGVPYRSRVDVADVEDGKCDVERLRDAPCGIQWELDFDGLERAVEVALKNEGIWTFDDLQQRDRAIVRIATDLVGRAIWDAAKRGCNGAATRPRR